MPFAETTVAYGLEYFCSQFGATARRHLAMCEKDGRTDSLPGKYRPGVLGETWPARISVRRPSMNKSNEVVFAPSIDWFKKKAKLLRKRVGRDSISHFGALNLLAKVYGFLDWEDFIRFKNGDQAFETAWDSELDERTLDERLYLQTSALTIELGLSDAEALQVLADIAVSQRASISAAAVSESGHTPEISSKPASIVEQKSTVSHTENPKVIQQPVVTYKRHRSMAAQTNPNN